MFQLPALSIVASGTTREAAIEELALDLVWLWKEYALAPREGLSQDAQEPSERFRGMIEEASVDTGIRITALPSEQHAGEILPDALIGRCSGLRILYAKQLHCDVLHPLGRERLVVSIARDCHYALYFFIARHDLPEGGVTAVEVGRCARHDEELRAR